VDAQGNRFKLKSANWHGASGTWNGEGDPAFDINHHCGENSYNLPLGLQYVPMADILDSMEEAGLNSVRLPFSTEMVKDTRAVQDNWVAANPQLRGKTPLEIYDAVVEALTARGFAVILNNHTVKSRWCCSVNDQNERWNESQTDAEWADVWLFMVWRYKDNKRVVGADLYNEVTVVASSYSYSAQGLYRSAVVLWTIQIGGWVMTSTGSPQVSGLGTVYSPKQTLIC